MKPNKPKKSLQREFPAKPKQVLDATQRAALNGCSRCSRHERQRQQYLSNCDTAVLEALQSLPPARVVVALERSLRTTDGRESSEVAIRRVRTDNESMMNCRGVAKHRTSEARGKIERGFSEIEAWVAKVLRDQWRVQQP